MRRLFTLLLLLSFFYGYSQDDARHRSNNYGSSVISISGSFNQPYTVYLDGREYRPDRNNEIYINVRPGNHNLRIMQQGRYVRSQIGRQIYSARINVRYQSQMDFMINRNGRVFKDEFAVRYDDYDLDYPNYPSNPNYPDYPGRPDYKQPMSATDFNGVIQTLKNQGFDNERLLIAKQVIGVNYFNVNQVREMMALFSFDESKLDIAKTAYPKTVDRENYFKINDELTYSSSKEELNRFLMSYKD